MATFSINIRFRIHKVTHPKNTDIFHCINLIHIMESGINYGNSHSLSLKARIMQKIDTAHCRLCDCRTVKAIGTHRFIY